jgi:hypothetical protein
MTLWTPSGEHPVDRRSGDTGSPGPTQAEPSTSPAPSPDAAGPTAGRAATEPEGPSLDDLSPEQRAQVEEMARQMEAARSRMLQLPVGTVVGQQALQFYELAAIYLSQDTPRLDDARIAIDALAAVVERLGSRLGDAEQPLRQALNQLQLAFVEASNQQS